MPIDCQVFKSAKQPDTYLYLERKKQHSELPEGLLTLLGDINPILHFKLHPEKRLAQAKAIDVIQAIQENGFYLQMPPKGNIQVDLHNHDH
ncbi:MAG: hypothetical protein ACI9J2_001793 [Saprospiraceae bacterium]|jgi:uncharacterized protein YcgL (UPF0745 family)